MEQKKIENITTIMKLIIPVIIICIIFTGLFSAGIITTNTDDQITSETSKIKTLENDENQPMIITATVILNYGDDTEDTYTISTINNTVMGFLLEIANKNGINIKTTYYGQYDSTLVDAIGEYEGGTDNKYWQYCINDEYGMIGVDKQIVNNNDIIEWKFEGYDY